MNLPDKVIIIAHQFKLNITFYNRIFSLLCFALIICGKSFSQGSSSGIVTPNIYNNSLPSYNSTFIDADQNKELQSSLRACSAAINPVPNAVCIGQAATLTAIAGTNSTGPFLYVWSPTGEKTENIVVRPTITSTYSVSITDKSGCVATASVEITITPPPTATIKGNLSICVGDATSLTASTVNLKACKWSTGDTTSSISVRPNTTTGYTVTVTNSLGCLAVASQTVVVHPKPIIDLQPTKISCNGLCNGSMQANPKTGTSPFNYIWKTFPEQTTQIATGLCAGVYIVSVTDANGCSTRAQDSITQPQSMTVVLSKSNVSCPNKCDASIIPRVTGGAQPYKFLWQPGGQTTQTVTGMCMGTFTFIVTDANGCSLASKDNITSVGTLPSPTITASNQSICPGNSIVITAGGGIKYSWSTGATTPSIQVNPITTTTYSANVSNGTCSKDTSITIIVNPTPSIAISASSYTVCLGNSATLTALSAGSTFLWSTASTASSIIITPTTASVYTVTATNSSKCSAIATASISVSSIKASIASTYTSICPGLAKDTLFASGGTTYIWSTGETSPFIVVSPDVTTTYTVIGKNTTQCTAVASYTLNVSGGFSPPVVDFPSTEYCLGDSLHPITGTSTSPSTITWLTVSGKDIAVGNTYYPDQKLPAGTYKIWCVQGTGKQCISYPTEVIINIHSLPVADAGKDVAICTAGETRLLAKGGIKYVWYPSSGLSDTTIAYPIATPSVTTFYKVIVKDANSCIATDSVTVFVTHSDTCGIHIYTGITPNGDGANDVWWIDGIAAFPDNNVDIFNRWGSLVWAGKNYDNKKVFWYGQNAKGEPLPAGTYYYVVTLKAKKPHSGWVELTR